MNIYLQNHVVGVVVRNAEHGSGQDRPTLVFDGECGFCTAMARWISRRVGRDRVHTVCWQRADLDRYGLSEREAREAVWWIDPSGRRFRAERAVGKALEEGRGWSKLLGSIILTPPFVWLAAPGYRLVARFRGHLPGVTPACPGREERRDRARSRRSSGES